MAQITIDPEVDEYEHALELLDVLYGRTDDDEDDDTAEEAPATSSTGADLSVPVDGFTQKRMNRYVPNLTPEGQLVLRYLVENGPQVQMGNVQNHLGKFGAEFAGTMSTFGHAVNKTKGVTNIPFSRHDRVYNINPAVAEMAKNALERYAIV